MAVTIEARTPQEAAAHAVKLKELVKNPLVRMAIESEGVRLANGEPNDALAVLREIGKWRVGDCERADSGAILRVRRLGAAEPTRPSTTAYLLPQDTILMRRPTR